MATCVLYRDAGYIIQRFSAEIIYINPEHFNNIDQNTLTIYNVDENGVLTPVNFIFEKLKTENKLGDFILVNGERSGRYIKHDEETIIYIDGDNQLITEKYSLFKNKLTDSYIKIVNYAQYEKKDFILNYIMRDISWQPTIIYYFDLNLKQAILEVNARMVLNNILDDNSRFKLNTGSINNDNNNGLYRMAALKAQSDNSSNFIKKSAESTEYILGELGVSPNNQSVLHEMLFIANHDVKTMYYVNFSNLNNVQLGQQFITDDFIPSGQVIVKQYENNINSAQPTNITNIENNVEGSTVDIMLIKSDNIKVMMTTLNVESSTDEQNIKYKTYEHKIFVKYNNIKVDLLQLSLTIDHINLTKSNAVTVIEDNNITKYQIKLNDKSGLSTFNIKYKVIDFSQ